MTDREKQGKRVVRRGVVSIHSAELNLTVRANVSDVRAPRLECLLSALEWLSANPKHR
jgi:hypothetical protein